jgi:hypothetical protein
VFRPADKARLTAIGTFEGRMQSAMAPPMTRPTGRLARCGSQHGRLRLLRHPRFGLAQAADRVQPAFIPEPHRIPLHRQAPLLRRLP